MSKLGNGIIGGNFTSAESYGKETAEAALRLLKGEQPKVRGDDGQRRR